MGVKKLTVECLPAYPYGMDLPMNASSNTLVRFDWKQNQDSMVNSASLDRVFEHVKVNGPCLWPAAASSLSWVHDADLRAKVVQRFGYMAKLWKNKRKAEEEAEKKAAEAAEQEAEDGVIAESEAVQSAMTTSAKNARAMSVSVKINKGVYVDLPFDQKLQQRVRKRPNSEYEDKKYDSAFTLAAMSADEDEADPAPGEAKKYVSRAPDYRSELVSNWSVDLLMTY